MRIHLEVVSAVHTRHPCPLGFDVIVIHKAYRTFHVIEEKFRIKAERIEQSVVKVKGKRTVIAVFGIVSLFHKQGSRRNKKPRFQVVVLDLQFANAKSRIAYSQFVAVTENIAGLVDILLVEAVVNSQITVERKHAQGAKLHIQRKHVVRQCKLVQAQVVVVTRAPVHHVATKVQTQPIVIQRNMRPVAGIADIFKPRIIFFFLVLQEFTVKRLRVIIRLPFRRQMAFVVNTGIQNEID